MTTKVTEGYWARHSAKTLNILAYFVLCCMCTIHLVFIFKLIYLEKFRKPLYMSTTVSCSAPAVPALAPLLTHQAPSYSSAFVSLLPLPGILPQHTWFPPFFQACAQISFSMSSTRATPFMLWYPSPHPDSTPKTPCPLPLSNKPYTYVSFMLFVLSAFLSPHVLSMKARVSVLFTDVSGA